MAGLGNTVYNLVFKRTSTYSVAIIVGCFFFERTLDVACDGLFEKLNKGKLWKDIKHKYE